MFRVAVNLCIKALDRADCLMTFARLSVLDWLAGPMPEPVTDRVIHEALAEIDIERPIGL
jgi:hypothetical protein